MRNSHRARNASTASAAWTLTVTVALLAVLAGGCRQSGPGDRGGAATSDDRASAGPGSARSNSAVQNGRPVNDTLPGRDSRPRQTAGHGGPQP